MKADTADMADVMRARPGPAPAPHGEPTLPSLWPGRRLAERLATSGFLAAEHRSGAAAWSRIAVVQQLWVIAPAG
jgi:hypothetical protein